MGWLHNAFDVGTFAVPAVWLALTLLVRHRAGCRQTSGADMLSAVIAFDWAAMVDPTYISRLAVTQEVAAKLHPMLVMLLVLGIAVWLIAMLYVEPKLAGNASDRNNWFASRPKPYLLGAASWGFCWTIAALHVLGFRGTI